MLECPGFKRHMAVQLQRPLSEFALPGTPPYPHLAGRIGDACAFERNGLDHALIPAPTWRRQCSLNRSRQRPLYADRDGGIALRPRSGFTVRLLVRE